MRANFGEGPYVLVVDDYADIRKMIALMLRGMGVAALEAANGLEAVEVATRQRPSLILMDISMPVMDGIEATRRLKALEGTRDIPIVILSAHSYDPTLRAQALEAGCDDLLAKPLENERIKDWVHKLALN